MTDLGEYDVIIVGSGAGGGSAAYGLSKRGVRVLVLEAGPHYDYKKDYLLHTAGWEKKIFPSRAKEEQSYIVEGLQPLDKEYDHLRSWNKVSGKLVTKGKRFGMSYAHVQGVGGSTLHFLGEAHRLNPASMKMRSTFGVGADWPINYRDLEPFYNDAEKIVGVAGNASTVPHRGKTDFPLPAHELSYGSQKLAAGCRKLGLTLHPNPQAILSQTYEGRPACNYCGNCIRGCPRADKGSVDVTFIAKALQTGRCRLATECQVTAVNAGPDGKIDSLAFVDKSNKTHIVKAKIYVVACGAVHTPRLLLASANELAPLGVANETGQVGRNFMETLFWSSSGFHPEPQIGSHRGNPADGICWDYNAPDSLPGIPGGCVFTSGAPQSGLMGPINYALRVVPGWGAKHKTQMRRSFGQILTMTSIGEFLPNSKTYVALHESKRDTRGVPLAAIHSFLDKTALKRLTFMARKSREILKAANVSEIAEEYSSYDLFAATHVFGTCRMGNDSKTSVVNKHCRAHEWQNLFVVDASVFPSSGGGESPSLTIEALGLRAARHIAERLRQDG